MRALLSPRPGPTLPRLLRPALLGLLVATVACDSEPVPSAAVPVGDATQVHLRFVDQDPQIYPPVGPIASWRFHSATGDTVAEWVFRGKKRLKGWTPRGLKRLAEGPNYADFRATRPMSFLTRDVDVDASRVYTVEVALKEVEGSAFDRAQGVARALSLSWRRAGGGGLVETPAPPVSFDVDGGVRRVRFHVGGHPGWKGRISKLRVQFAGYSSLSLKRIALFGPPGVDAMPPPAEEVGKFMVGGVVRNGLVGSPGTPIEREVSVPAGARLRLAYGVAFVYGGAARFRVRAERPDGSVEELHSDIWRGGDSSSWKGIDVDLGPFAGQTIKFRLEVEPDPQGVAGWGLPVWGTPEILVPRSADAEPRPNIILISVDTLRPDRMSGYGHSRSTSPHLDALVRRGGVVFENVIATASWTLPTHVSMLTGLNTLEHGVHHAPVPFGLTTVAEQLRDHGYSTMAVTGTVLLAPDRGFIQGFDRYYSSPRTPLDAFEDELTHARAWLEAERARPFFLFFHTYEVHDPFYARPPYFQGLVGSEVDPPREPVWIVAPSNEATRERAIEGAGGPTLFGFLFEGGSRQEITPPDQQLIADVYDAGIGYMDSGIQSLFETLRRLDLHRSTIVVLTSDHGEGLGEHGEYRHRTLYEEIVRIPLIVSVPGLRPPTALVSRQVSQADITPTILDLAGAPPLTEGSGRSLVPLLRDPGAPFEETAWSYAPGNYEGVALRLGNREKYIVNDTALEPLRGRERLFDLARDPGENSGAEAAPSALRQRAADALSRTWQGVKLTVENADDVELLVRLPATLGPTRLRSLDFGEIPARYEGSPPEVRVLPGDSWSGWWLGWEPFDLEMEWAEGERAAFRRSVTWSALAEPLEVVYADGEWKEGTAGAVRARLVLEAHGRGRGQG